MTHIYFVRHAQPEHSWEDDRTRPLTCEGMQDSKAVADLLKNVNLNYAISSPYKRSVDTIQGCAKAHGLELHIDERLRERQKGPCSNQYGMYQKRWADFDFCEEGGESLRMVQERNMQAVLEMLEKYSEKNILVGTHGTALSTIINYYDSSFRCDAFLRIIDFMPYIIRMDFKGQEFQRKEEMLIIEKVFEGKTRADRNG